MSRFIIQLRFDLSDPDEAVYSTSDFGGSPVAFVADDKADDFYTLDPARIEIFDSVKDADSVIDQLRYGDDGKDHGDSFAVIELRD